MNDDLKCAVIALLVAFHFASHADGLALVALDAAPTIHVLIEENERECAFRLKRQAHSDEAFEMPDPIDRRKNRHFTAEVLFELLESVQLRELDVVIAPIGFVFECRMKSARAFHHAFRSS